MDKNQHTHIHLIGDPEENFYTLGKRDKNAFEDVYKQISMLCIKNNLLAKIIKTTTEFSGKFVKKADSNQIEDLKAYASGIERPIEDLMFALLLPEMVSAFNKWSPDFLTLIPGCSSLFVWDQQNEGVIHNRILDYALSGPFEQYERTVLYELTNRKKVFSLSSGALALPGLSCMNEDGLSLALHYKHNDYFNLEGESIFLMANELINNCSNIREALKFLRKKKSISHWGLYLADQSGEVLSADIVGGQIYQEKFDLKDHKYLYFNNKPLIHNPKYDQLQPFGKDIQCQMRANVLKNNIHNLNYEAKDLMLDTLKCLSTVKSKKSNSSTNYQLSPVNPSTIQLYSLHNKLQKAYFVPGTAPKLIDNGYYKLENIFENQTSEFKTVKSKKSKEYIKGLEFISQFQTSLDRNDITKAYHSLQMAIELLKDHEEKSVVQFYFYILEYIYEKDKRDLSFLYHDFETLEGLLPDYLEDHRKLFILRVAKLLNHNIKNEIKEIKNPKLKELYRREFNLNKVAHKGLKFLIFPRIEILDIIYAY